MVTSLVGLSPGWVGMFSILRTRDLPFSTSPKTTCFPSRCGVGTVVTKNWEPFVPGGSRQPVFLEIVMLRERGRAYLGRRWPWRARTASRA